MNIPDMADFARLETQLERMERLLLGIHSVTAGGEWISVKEIAMSLGLSEATLSEKPWLLPNNGICLDRKRNRRWRRTDWENWNATPVENREAAYRQWKAAMGDERQ